MIHGLALINKPLNLSSHAVVERVRRLLREKKAGHFGALDPLASGLLMIGLGNATKFFDFYIKKNKRYSGRIRFGYATATYDAEGPPISEKKTVNLFQTDIPALLKPFIGKQMQTPPIYSAKKYKGKPLYEYARKNQDVPVKAVEIEIFSLSATVADHETLAFETTTSSGTYIRSLAHDMGQTLGCGAYLESLSRDAAGEFSLDNAHSLEDIADAVQNNDMSRVVTPIELLLPEFPKVIVTSAGRQGILNGMPLPPGEIIKLFTSQDMEYFRIFDDEGKLLAIARKDERQMRFVPFMVFPA